MKCVSLICYETKILVLCKMKSLSNFVVKQKCLNYSLSGIIHLESLKPFYVESPDRKCGRHCVELDASV